MGTVDGAHAQARPSGRASIAAQAAYAFGALFAMFEVISIHSILAGNPAIGALQGLAVVGIIALALTRLVPAGRDRTRQLARLALLTSVVALPLTRVLWTRATQAQGATPDAGPFVQLFLFLLFQAGLALTHWLSAEKGRTDPSRYIPAAIGTSILLVGSVMSTFGIGPGRAIEGATRTTAEPAEVYKTFATAEDYAFAQETRQVGTERGATFAHFHAGRAPMLGVSFGTHDWFRRVRIGDDIRGVFAEGAPAEGAHQFLARPGYAVAAFELQADDYVNALRVEFAPFDGSRLSSDERYWSEWAGSYQVGERITKLESGAALVVGFRGTGGMVLNSLSLLVALPEE